jgi:hypothetical protein
MSIRRLHLQIDYIHILTFKDEYKSVVIPYFGFDNLEYGIDNENTIHEGIRLIFKNEYMTFILRKEAIALIFDGDARELKNQNGPIKFFWEMYEKIKTFRGYRKTTRMVLITHAVDIRPPEEVASLLKDNPYLKKNPFGQLDEFACVYEFNSDEIKYKLQFGNYSKKDLRLHELRPFKNPFNDDLLDNVGTMGRLELTANEGNPTFGKFKSLLTASEKAFAPFNLVKDE